MPHPRPFIATTTCRPRAIAFRSSGPPPRWTGPRCVPTAGIRPPRRFASTGPFAHLPGAILWRPSLFEASRDPQAGMLALAFAVAPLLAIVTSVLARGGRSASIACAAGRGHAWRDFSDNMGRVFVGERRVFAIRNARCAEALETANQDRLRTDQIRARDNRRKGTVAVVRRSFARVRARHARIWLLPEGLRRHSYSRRRGERHPPDHAASQETRTMIL